jgi:hypothetical protein
MAEQRDLFYVIECAADNCIAEFYVNDVPIARRGKECGHFIGAPVNEYILKGTNEIAFVVNPGGTPGNALLGEGGKRDRCIPEKDAKVSAILARYPRGAVVGGPDRDELIGLEWTRDENAYTVFPLVRSVQLELDPPFGPWPWEQFPHITLDETVIGEVMDFIKEMHLALAAGYSEHFAEKCHHRFTDVEQAHFLEPGDREAEAKQLFSYVMEEPGWAMVPLDQVEPDLRLCAQDRMVQLIAKDWHAILRQQPDEEGRGIFFPMMVSKIDEEWQIVR